MFFPKPLKQVTFDDVLAFCSAKIKENEVLDYKEDFPSKLEKILAAFANTYGGLIIIGVAEQDGKPIDNPQGIPFQDGLEERVTSIIMSNITPPFFPEIQVCEPKNGKTFILIQIPQSSNTPHAIENNTKVYLRTGNISQLERFANLDELHWLSRNRESAVYLRDSLINFARRRFRVYSTTENANIDFAELQVYCVPLFPTSPPAAKIENIYARISKNDFVVNTGMGSIFPSVHKGMFQTVKDGMSLFVNTKNSQGEKTEYTVIDAHGLVLHIEDLGYWQKFQDDKPEKMLYLTHVIDAYANLLKFYRKILPDLQVWGDFKIMLELVKIENVLPVGINHGTMFRSDLYPFHDKAYVYGGAITYNTLTNDDLLTDELKQFTLDLHWSFGVPIQEQDCITWLSKNIKW